MKNAVSLTPRRPLLPVPSSVFSARARIILIALLLLFADARGVNAGRRSCRICRAARLWPRPSLWEPCLTDQVRQAAPRLAIPTGSFSEEWSAQTLRLRRTQATRRQRQLYRSSLTSPFLERGLGYDDDNQSRYELAVPANRLRAILHRSTRCQQYRESDCAYEGCVAQSIVRGGRGGRNSHSGGG